jgi:hypothetical protein
MCFAVLVRCVQKLGLTADMYDALSLVLTWRPATTTAPMGQRITGTTHTLYYTIPYITMLCNSVLQHNASTYDNAHLTA